MFKRICDRVLGDGRRIALYRCKGDGSEQPGIYWAMRTLNNITLSGPFDTIAVAIEHAERSNQ